MEQTLEQNESTLCGSVGLWLFILSEIMLFGGFLAGYVMLRWGSTVCALGTPAWPKGGYGTGLALATLNTAVLLSSSWSMARATAFARHGNPEAFRRSLATTITLGVVFLVIKGGEYALKIHHGYYPKSVFMAANPGLVIFISFYFLLTFLHALHVTAGLVWNGLLFKLNRPEDAAFQAKLEYAALYWHFVDVIWIILFPLFYLI